MAVDLISQDVKHYVNSCIEMGIRTSAIKYLHRRSNTRYKKSVVVKEHLRVKVNAEYFANQTGFCTDLY